MRIAAGAQAMCCFVILICAAPGPTQEKVQFPEPRSIPQDLQPDGINLQGQRAELVARRAALVSAVQSHTARCSSVEEGTPLESACRQAQAALLGKLRKYSDDVQKFHAAMDSAIAEANDSGVLARREQAEFDSANPAWLQKQHESVRRAAEQSKAWLQELIAAIRTSRAPAPGLQQNTLRDLKTGDIILIAPGNVGGELIIQFDFFARTAEKFARGEVFAAAAENLAGGRTDLNAINTREAPVSHAVTFVKAINGKLLFLDHTFMVGSRILDEKSFTDKYGARGMYLARPAAVVDGSALWTSAREAALQRRSNFGLFGTDVVCSERAGLAVAKATGLSLENHRLGPVDITPADFFDQQGVGKYFVLSGLRK
jgi:hypothetical protein